MARSRNIKPGLFKNEVLGVADPLLTLLFEGLWLLADREGRLEDRPLRIKAEVFPYRDGIDMEAMLNWLQSYGFIRRYEAQGRKCIAVLEFVRHQNPHKNEPESSLPAPDEIGTTSEKIGSTRADSGFLIPDSGLLIPESAADAATPAAPPPAPKPKNRKPIKTLMPDDFGVSERVKSWAAEKGHGRLAEHLESFRSKCAAKGYAYVDWDEAFMNAIRDDWAKLRGQPQQFHGGGSPPPVTVASDAAAKTAAELAKLDEHAKQATRAPAEVRAKLDEVTKHLRTA